MTKDWYFIVMPVFFAILCIYSNCVLDKDMVDILNTGLSIFIGLFFNVVFLIFDIIKKNTDVLKQTVLKQTLTNICYLILVAILGILVAYCTLFHNTIVANIANFITYFIISHFFLTVLMVLKRVYILFIVEFDDSVKKK